MLQADVKVEELDVAKGMDIYNMIKDNPELSPAQLVNLENNTHLYTSFKKVINKKDRLFAEMNTYSSGNKLLSEELFHFDEETGEKVIDTPAVYYTLTTEADFKSQFESDLLDTDEVYNDWKGDRTWSNIKNPIEE